VVALSLTRGCGGLGGDAVPPGAAPPDAPVTSSPVPDTPIPSPTPRIVEPRDGLVDVRPQVWDEAEPLEGRTVLLSFYGGVEECYGVDRVEVDYRAQTVVLTLYTGRVPGADVCIEIAEYQAVEVHLDEPLGDRRVVDGAPGA
jgi:hypothetical protein